MNPPNSEALATRVEQAHNVTSHDVARLVGVSQSTVSRALRDDHRISEATKQRVRAAVAELGYVPSDVGRSLVTRSTRTIAIVITDLSSVFYPYLIAPLHDEVESRGYRMVLFTESLETDGEPTGTVQAGAEAAAAKGASEVTPLLDRLLDRSVDGVVLTTSRLDGTVPRELARRSLPFVFMTRFVDGIAADIAVVDNSLGASLAAAEAVRLGHSRFAAIFGPANTSSGRDRERGVRAALTAAGLSLDADLVRHGPFTYETGYAGMVELMQREVPPTVVLCGNDTVAIGAFNAAAALGRAVPADVSIVGFDDLPMASWEVFNLTTVHQPIEEMARTAVGLLIDRIEGGVERSTVRHRVFEPRMVMRGTLAPPADDRR
jgi:LacI family transcriptional regulator